MTKVFLQSGQIKKLKRESRGSGFVFMQVCREAIVRRWLAQRGIPSWRNPVSPPAEYNATYSRYSILLSDGSRFLVTGADDAVISFDSMARAKCFAVLGVSLEDDCSSGLPVGFSLLSDIPPGINRFDFTDSGHKPPVSLIEKIGTSRGYILPLLKFSIRLLILGEPDAPVWGTMNVTAFQPAIQNGGR